LPIKRFLTSTQAADYLGISRPTLYKLADNKEVTVYKIVGTYRFTKGDLDEYLLRIKVASKHSKKRHKKPRRKKR